MTTADGSREGPGPGPRGRWDVRVVGVDDREEPRACTVGFADGETFDLVHRIAAPGQRGQRDGAVVVQQCRRRGNTGPSSTGFGVSSAAALSRMRPSGSVTASVTASGIPSIPPRSYRLALSTATVSGGIRPVAASSNPRRGHERGPHPRRGRAGAEHQDTGQVTQPDLARRLEVGLEIPGTGGRAEDVVTRHRRQDAHRRRAARPVPRRMRGVVLHDEPAVAERGDPRRRPHRRPGREPQCDLRTTPPPSTADRGMASEVPPPPVLGRFGHAILSRV